MARIEHYLKELNIICFAVCLLIVATFWIEHLTPDLYAAIQVVIEYFDPKIFIDEINPEKPTDFVNKLFK